MKATKYDSAEAEVVVTFAQTLTVTARANQCQNSRQKASQKGLKELCTSSRCSRSNISNKTRLTTRLSWLAVLKKKKVKWTDKRMPKSKHKPQKS